MKNFFDSWKYIVKNIWFVLPFAIIPAVFLALSLDYTAIGKMVVGIFTGFPPEAVLDAVESEAAAVAIEPRMPFLTFFSAWSIIGITELNWIFSILAFVCIVVFAALMLFFVEKHMRIGKRTLSGITNGFFNNLLSVFVIALLYMVLYELWTLALSAMLFWISSIPELALVYILGAIAFAALLFGLLFVSTVFYLWLPCRQMTGFGFYHTFVYSYRLMLKVRWRLVLEFLISIIVAFIVLGGSALLPEFVFRMVGVVVFALFFLSFCIRMETVYFQTDKLDREDLIKHYKEY